MYRTCLFCNSDLGGNEALEHLQIGRRVAFDQAQGRLWVVCRKCERWNLTPFGDRFEAIEEGEKLFRDTKVRFSTDQIGLARLRDGTELVRIGEPLRPEFAAWRYGDQFGRRRLRHFALVGVGVIGVAGLVIAPKLLGLSVGGGGLYNIYSPLLQAWKAKKTVAQLELPDGGQLPVTQLQIEKSELRFEGVDAAWGLRVPERKGTGRVHFKGNYVASLEGEAAERALRKIQPRVNRQGAGRDGVKTAVGVQEESPTTEALVARVSRMPYGSWKEKREGRRTLGNIKSEMRLALEMSSHEDAERRWLAGELLDLERAWREAEELAGIADKLGLPEEVERQVAALKEKSP